MRTITGDEALALLKRAVDLRGDNHRAGECVYADGGKPVCLVGTALVEAGVPVLALERMDRQQNGDGGSIDKPRVLEILASDGEVTLEPRALALFRTAQSYQDDGGTWGDAVWCAAEEVASA